MIASGYKLGIYLRLYRKGEYVDYEMSGTTF